MRYGIGFMLGNKVASFYGPNTASVFGHLGFTTVLCYADPVRDVSVCLMSTGKPLITPALWRVYEVVKAIARRCRPVRQPAGLWR